MQPQSFVELIRGGGTSAVEQQWSSLLESSDANPTQLAGYDVALQELCDRGKFPLAEELAWTAIETVLARYPAIEILPLAGPFLLAVGESETLRKQVSDLYRSAFADREGVEALLAEAGLEGGRPVRRALRTLDVCLAVNEGDFLVSRDEDYAARIDSIERPAWRYILTGVEGTQTCQAVPLADRYRPASADEFAVMRQFAPEALVARLWDDPGPMLTELCRRREKGLDDDALQGLLVPNLIPPTDWKKWWTQARSALKRCPQLKLEGRSPSTLVYTHAPTAAHEEMLIEWDRRHDPLGKLAVIEKYLRECKARAEAPDAAALQHCLERLIRRAEPLTASHAPQAGLRWVTARRVAALIGVQRNWRPAVEWFQHAGDIAAILRPLEDGVLFDIACDWFAEARPDRWRDQLLAAIPHLLHLACYHAARRLVAAGKEASDFEPIVQTVMNSPVQHFGALLWLWGGPTNAEQIPVPSLPSILSRILRTLDDCRRSEELPKEMTRAIATEARAVLAARQYQRFQVCLEQLDGSVAHTYVRQIQQLTSLGKSVPADLVSLIRRRFPLVQEPRAGIQPWEQEHVIYVTAAGLGKKQEEIQYHVNVRMKENAVAIGRAAEHGDLSENSEYKFALEERDLLRARLAQMNAEVAAARVLSVRDVPTDYVGIGTKVILQRVTDGQRYEMTLVGPWEADASARRFNYMAPLPRKILGKRVGDIVEFDHSGAVGTYRIVALENALASNADTPKAPSLSAYDG